MPNLVVKTPHINLNATPAEPWANGFTVGVEHTIQEAMYADEAVARRAVGGRSDTIGINVPAETDTHAASAALWSILGTKVDGAFRASDAVVGATNPEYTNDSGSTSKIIPSSLNLQFTVNENAGVDLGMAMDGKWNRATS